MEYLKVFRYLNKKINISYYLKNIASFCTYFINYNKKYQSSSKSLLKALRKLKNDKVLDEDEVSNIKDILA